MTLSPSFGSWPPGGTLIVPTVQADVDVPLPDVGASAFLQLVDGVLKLKLPNGTVIDVGPAAAPTVIAPRAVVSVQSNLPDPPTLVYEQGAGIVLGVSQSPITFSYTLTCSVPISDATAAVLVTIKGQTPLQAVSVTFPGGGDIRVAGQEADLDGGGITISAVSLDFTLALY